MRPVLILQNQPGDSAAYLKTWLDSRSIDNLTCHAANGFPDSIDGYSAMAVLGGSMSANDPLESNRQAELLIKEAMRLGKPVIGHCLGGQLMCRALGGTVGKSPKPEIGWQPLDWIDTELTSEWFGPDPTARVMHWHWDAFTLPAGATSLATSPACPVQAFAYGDNLAMQFHIEVDRAKVERWTTDTCPDWAAAQGSVDTVQGAGAILEGIGVWLDSHQATANHIYRRWLRSTVWTRRCA